MTTLDTILDAQPCQLSIDELMADIEAEESGDGLEPGTSVGHADFADFRGVYVGPGRRPGIALVRVTAGWLGGELPAWPVSIPYNKLTEV